MKMNSIIQKMDKDMVTVSFELSMRVYNRLELLATEKRIAELSGEIFLVNRTENEIAFLSGIKNLIGA